MPAVLERTRAGVDAANVAAPPDDPHRGAPSPRVADGGQPPDSGGDEEGRPGRGLPLGVAVAVVILVAVMLTYLGMLTQIWANLSGAQLPGA